VHSVPMISIGGVRVPRLILGHLPFLGESYQGPSKNAEYSRRFSGIRSIVTVLTKAVKQYGITVMSAPTPLEGRSAIRLLKAIERISQSVNTCLALIICLRIPLLVDDRRIDDYRRWLTYYHIEKRYGETDILWRYLSDPVLQARENWESRFIAKLKTSQPYSQELEKLEIDYDRVRKALAGLEDVRVLFIELGSETDFLAMGKRLDILSDLVGWISDNFGYKCLLGCHHGGLTIPILERSKIDFYGYVTPANKLGVMMFPTQKLSEAAIKSTSKPVIAIKPFAGGRIPPKPALEYIYKDLNIPCCMIGVGSEEELERDATVALQLLSGKPDEIDRYSRSYRRTRRY